MGALQPHSEGSAVELFAAQSLCFLALPQALCVFYFLLLLAAVIHGQIHTCAPAKPCAGSPCAALLLLAVPRDQA
jgi:hypothetical protein